MGVKVTYTAVSNISEDVVVDGKLIRVDTFDPDMETLKFKSIKTGKERMDTFINVSMYYDIFFIGQTAYKPLHMLTKPDDIIKDEKTFGSLTDLRDGFETEIDKIHSTTLKDDVGVLDINDTMQTKSFSRGRVIGLVIARDRLNKLINRL